MRRNPITEVVGLPDSLHRISEKETAQTTDRARKTKRLSRTSLSDQGRIIKLTSFESILDNFP